MKKTNTIYWIFTGLASAMMLLSSIPNILAVPDAVDIVIKHLGYPTYFLPMIGVAKLAGAIAILIPGFPRVKEWAYAGLIYDLVAAIYSAISVGDSVEKWLPILVPIILLAGSYVYHHKRLLAANV